MMQGALIREGIIPPIDANQGRSFGVAAELRGRNEAHHEDFGVRSAERLRQSMLG
jgi:hypothetical protein